MNDKLKAWRAEQAEYLALLGIEQAVDTPVFNNQLSMTMNTYAHFLDAEDIATAAAMDAILRPGEKGEL